MRVALFGRVAAVVGLSLVAASCGGSGGGGGGGGPPSVLIIHAADVDYVSDVIAKLSAFGVFAEIEPTDASSSTPNADTLLPYDAVLVMSDQPFADPVALGNVLADYVDGGGGVVLTMFTLSTPGADTLQGRFETDDYYVIPRSLNNGTAPGPFGMTVVDPTHPILDGVSTFSGGDASYRPEGSVVPASYDLVATWNDALSTPLVATRSIGGVRRADVGFYPPTTDVGRTDFVDPSTDALLLLANALRWVAGDL